MPVCITEEERCFWFRLVARFVVGERTAPLETAVTVYALFGGSEEYYGWVADVSGRARGFGSGWEIENKKSAREERVREEKDEKEG